MMKSCVMCGSPLPESHLHKTCSMCYGDIDYGTDGYYRQHVEEEARSREGTGCNEACGHCGRCS